jgi:hypothetical protein
MSDPKRKWASTRLWDQPLTTLPPRSDGELSSRGFQGLDTEVVGQLTHLLLGGEGQFILLAESERHIQSPGYDHLGFLLDTRAEVDDLLARCREHQTRDPRVQIKNYDDLVVGDLTVRAFYVKYLLPIWFDVQCMEQKGVAQPAWPARG